MDANPTLPLLDRLRVCAALWADAQDGSPARLARLVLNDGGFFTRLESPAASTTTATLERFARFLTDPANWPADEHGKVEVPREVVAFGHVTGISAGSDSLSRGTTDAISTREAAA